eukprot:s1342_g8.t1
MKAVQAMLRLFVLRLALILEPSAGSAGTCLPEAVPESSRKFLELDSGSSPVQLLIYDWASAELGSTIAAILIQEVLGYHARLDSERTDFDCTSTVERKHVAVESWLSEVITLSYNTSHHDPKKYFDSFTDIPQSEFFPCDTAGNEFVNTVRMDLYVQYTGDEAGVTLTPDGYVAYCPDGYFWLSPACRHDPSSCIPIIAAGNGWIIDAQMQWATAYGFPAAIGIAATWDLYVHQVATYKTLFYWSLIFLACSSMRMRLSEDPHMLQYYESYYQSLGYPPGTATQMLGGANQQQHQMALPAPMMPGAMMQAAGSLK